MLGGALVAAQTLGLIGPLSSAPSSQELERTRAEFDGELEVLAYHSTGRASNGRVENMHMLAEKIRRNAHGFANHDNYRRRLIGRLGIKSTTVPTRRIRGRKPRLIAQSPIALRGALKIAGATQAQYTMSSA